LINLNGLKSGFKFIDNFPKENPKWSYTFFIKVAFLSNNGKFKECLDA
jgi:hypothetical protein